MAKSLPILAMLLPFMAAPGFAASQSITFDAIANQLLGAPPFILAAESTSRFPVTFVSSTPAVCKTAGSLVTLLNGGICSITASQPGNFIYTAATPVTQFFTVSPAGPSGTLAVASGSPVATGTVPLSSPLAAAIGDFNRDGVPDLAIATSSNDLVILLGSGTGKFGPPALTTLNSGLYPNSLVVGDFNGDGIQDLATANLESNNVTVLLGNGSGGFTEAPASPFAVGPYPYSVVIGDFNGDGVQDLATANNAGDTVTVLLGDGDAGFTEAPGSPFAVQGDAPVSLLVGDFNGDGIQDLAIADFSSDDVTVLLGGAGGFTAVAAGPFATGTGPSALAIGDFNGDGIPDLATANVFDNDVTILLGDGRGAFKEASGSPFAAGVNPTSLAVADFNGDGIPDLITANNGNAGPFNNVTVLLGNGAGGFTPVAGNLPAPGSSPDVIVAGDFNHDGIEDVAVANFGSNDLTVLLGGSASTVAVLSTLSLSVAAGQSVPLTLSVSDTHAAFSKPTGTATFSNGGTDLGVAVQSASPWRFIATSLNNGNHTFTATYSGDRRSAPSTSNTLTVAIGLEAQSIAFAPLNTITLPAPPFALSATATSGLPVSFMAINTDICTMTGTNVTPVAAGICAITATQAGNSQYAAATPVTQSFTIDPATSSPALPVPTGIANAASASQATPEVVAPGTYVAIYGIGLAGTGNPSAPTLPLPTTLNGVQVSLGGSPLPLAYASGGQVNGLVPQNLAPGSSYPLVVATATAQSLPAMLLVKGVQPGIYTLDTTGSGPGIIASAATGLLINSANPAHAGDYLVVYCTGLGIVAGPNGEPAPPDGAAAPVSPVYYTATGVIATVGNIGATVTFAGLTPGFAGLYQVNVRVPPGVTAGDSVPVVIAATDPQSGETVFSNSVTIAVQ